MTRDRFPVTAAAVNVFLNQPSTGVVSHDISRGLAAVAPHVVASWIDALTDADLLSLRFNPGADWCQQMRAELTRLTEEESR